MKYLRLALIALLFAGCDSSQGDIAITGTAPGVNYGNVMIKDQSKNIIYHISIEGGKFDMPKAFLKYSGYYNLTYSQGTKSPRTVEVYLQPGTYAITLDWGKINNYPAIKSSSKMQTELSAYNTMADSLKAESRKQVVAIHSQLTALDSAALTIDQRDVAEDKLRMDEYKANEFDELKVFTTFMKKYPTNEVAPHILLQMNYQDDPVAYYALFNKLTTDAKNTADGKELESKLQPLAKLAPGAQAPAIAGTTPDGKAINIKALNKKVILLDFWRSSNGSSRQNHNNLARNLLVEFKDRGFGVVSVSFDTDKAKWVTAIAHDEMTWPQLSDLKGDDSPNAQTWGIKSIPTYYLLDGSGHIIGRVNEFADVPGALDKFYQTHP